MAKVTVDINEQDLAHICESQFPSYFWHEQRQ